ncbi:MAG TPA: hypothetical protein VIB79_07390 [Candidatus Binatia bacterium]|jgi:hypothetical protein
MGTADLDMTPTGSFLTHRSSGDGTPAIPRCDAPTFAFTSGKHGVGKPNIVANLAMAFVSLGARILVIDPNVGLASLDFLLGIKPKYTFAGAFLQIAARLAVSLKTESRVKGNLQFFFQRDLETARGTT